MADLEENNRLTDPPLPGLKHSTLGLNPVNTQHAGL